MEIRTYTTPYLSSHMYLIVENGHAVIVDPCETPELKRDLEGLTCDWVLLTHEHDDHITGVEWAKQALGARVLCSAVCAENIQDPRTNYSYYYELMKSVMTDLADPNSHLTPFSCTATDSFEFEHTLLWQGHTLFLKETPGHSRGGICILLDGKCLFTGDSLMQAEIATRFKGGSLQQYREQTLPYLRSLDADIAVYPGHYGPFRLGRRLTEME